ncbi:MAG: alpha/beta hydrolase [Dehalococcoidia bacterium]|nr:alpha/beta hydrolase [Dehalococcoidia bacterium]
MAKSCGPAPGYGSLAKVNNLNIHVWQIGHGIPVVLLHGFMGMAYDWRFNIPEIGKQFSVYALDLPGFGYSDKPLNFDYTSDGYADFLVSFLNANNISRAVLIGNSMGGQIALMACLKFPERVAGLVLIDSGGYPHSVEFLPFKLLTVPVIGEISMALVNRTIIKIMLGKGIYFDGSFATDEVINSYHNVYSTVNARKMPPMIMRTIMKDEAHIASNLSQIKCHTLIIWGAEDKVISPSRAEMFRRDIKNASTLIMPQAGHMPQVEKSEAVNNAVINFVRQCPYGG